MNDDAVVVSANSRNELVECPGCGKYYTAGYVHGWRGNEGCADCGKIFHVALPETQMGKKLGITMPVVVVQ